jgi:hypothetical protein
MAEGLSGRVEPKDSDKTRLIRRSNGNITPVRIAAVENPGDAPDIYMYNADKDGVYEERKLTRDSDYQMMTEAGQEDLARELSGLPLKGDRVVKKELGGYTEGTITHYENHGDRRYGIFNDGVGNKSSMRMDDLAIDRQAALKMEKELPFTPNSWDETKLIRRSGGAIVPMKIAAERNRGGSDKMHAYTADDKGILEHKPILDPTMLSDEAQAELEKEYKRQIGEVGEEVLESVGVQEPIPDEEKVSDVHGLANVAQGLDAEGEVVPEFASTDDIIKFLPENRRMRDKTALVSYAIAVEGLQGKPNDPSYEAIKKSNLSNMSAEAKKYADRYAELAAQEKKAA